MFNSKAIQIINQWDAERTRIVLVNKEDENNMINGIEDIKKEGT